MAKVEQSPVLGHAFNDVLTELHAHVFTGVPGESDPFVLSMLDREYLAFVLACYYQCEHCQRHHERAIDRERRQLGVRDWNWKKELVRTTLFLRTSRSDVSVIEWREWEAAWKSFAQRIHLRHPSLACYIAYAIGIARNDHTLMDLAFNSISGSLDVDAQVKGVIRDIDRVVIFMKAATSKNRTDSVIIRHLKSRGLSAS
ncbi:hypothetical protein CKO25_13550 [Thiocapsa imhoffii]|uniref:Carboxymuconolactone decarboxylase family protein n=1 Tax=Thiocapsa imhoffii TaxID=382777 RepID=A0A9X0WJC6_9GAMM|nr:hypothetical protein [Thiocapsa imhoffii]MBK1645653.1 hypothetical protein [Thiocapsa imhoffii]